MSDRQYCFRCARNAWQKLGNMNPEVAMEQYVSLLSDKFPGWMKDTSAVSFCCWGILCFNILTHMAMELKQNPFAGNRWTWNHKAWSFWVRCFWFEHNFVSSTNDHNWKVVDSPFFILVIVIHLTNIIRSNFV